MDRHEAGLVALADPTSHRSPLLAQESSRGNLLHHQIGLSHFATALRFGSRGLPRPIMLISPSWLPWCGVFVSAPTFVVVSRRVR